MVYTYNIDKYSTVLQMYFFYEFIVLFSIAYFIKRIQYITYVTHKMLTVYVSSKASSQQ